MCVCVCVCYAVRSAPPSQFGVSAKSIIVKNVRMPTLVGNKLFIGNASWTHVDVEFSYLDLCNVLCREALRSTLVDLGGSSGGG